MEPLIRALQQALPSAVRVADTLRVPEAGGGWRVLVPRAPWDPQIDHGYVLPFCPPLDDSMGLDACHLRGRLLRSPDAIEAARGYAAGQDVEANANVLAVEAARQLGEIWVALAQPLAWTGPGATFVLQSVNVAPAEAEHAVSLLRAGAYAALGKRAEARTFLKAAQVTADPGLRRVAQALAGHVADA